jgi:hypothetical protein
VCMMEDQFGEAGEDDETCDGDVGLDVLPLPRGQAAHKG